MISLHEALADLKSRQAELELQIEEETSKFDQQENELVTLKEEVDKCKMEMKNLNGNLKLENVNKNSIVQEMRVLRDQLDEIQAGEQRGDSIVRYRSLSPEGTRNDRANNLVVCGPLFSKMIIYSEHSSGSRCWLV